MNSGNETVLLARRVNGMLKTYMSVQDDLFKPSIRKIVRIPGIYRPIDYKRNLETLAALLKDLADIKAAIRHEDPDATTPDGRFLTLLRGYVSLMTAAVEKLAFVCEGLKKRSEGSAYGKEEYRNDMAELRELQKKHLESGVALNEAMKKVQRKEEAGELT